MTLRQVKNAVASSVRGQTLSSWLREASEISDSMAGAVEGIYTGQFGRMREELSDSPGHFLVIGWGYGRIEYAYVS